ncbi:hypothetical protein LX36DRAFT_350182 [Colletotrichum falcatum]|nr:hypothetical protein LX36DRAFT_350182 [Colletotrichum falcatum]
MDLGHTPHSTVLQQHQAHPPRMESGRERERKKDEKKGEIAGTGLDSARCRCPFSDLTSVFTIARNGKPFSRVLSRLPNLAPQLLESGPARFFQQVGRGPGIWPFHEILVQLAPVSVPRFCSAECGGWPAQPSLVGLRWLGAPCELPHFPFIRALPEHQG